VTAPTPTQVRHPWRATLRTLVAVLLALLPLLPEILAGLRLDTTQAGAQTLAVAAAVTRLLASPAVDGWLRQRAPWLAASPRS
jgi:hypothetical protein